MKAPSKKTNLTFDEYPLEAFRANGNDYVPKPSSRESIHTAFEKRDDFKNFLQQSRLPNMDDVLMRIAELAGKKSFLVFTHNKYINVPTENIAFFHIKYGSSIIMCFDRLEYLVNQSLE